VSGPSPTGLDEGPLREPEAEQPNDLDRRLRHRDRRAPWPRIVVLALALVGILAFHESIGREMAGCFGELAQPVAQADAVSPPAELNLRIEPARPLPRVDASP